MAVNPNNEQRMMNNLPGVSKDYDPNTQMFVEQPGEPNNNHWKFLRELNAKGQGIESSTTPVYEEESPEPAMEARDQIMDVLGVPASNFGPVQAFNLRRMIQFQQAKVRSDVIDAPTDAKRRLVTSAVISAYKGCVEAGLKQQAQTIVANIPRFEIPGSRKP